MSRGYRRPFKACTRCRLLVPHDTAACPSCGSTSFTDTWSGVVIVVDPERSKLARMLDIKKPGRYALRLGP